MCRGDKTKNEVDVAYCVFYFLQCVAVLYWFNPIPPDIRVYVHRVCSFSFDKLRLTTTP